MPQAPNHPGDPEPLVLHVIPTATARGAQREARAVADALDEPGVRRHRVLCLFDGPEQVPVDHALRLAAGGGGAGAPRPAALRAIRRELRILHPSVVVAHGSDPMKFLVPAMFGLRARLVYYAIGTYAGDPGRRLQVMLWRFLARRAAVVAACGEETLAECRTLLRLPARRTALIVNGRDPAAFRPLPRDPGAPPTALFVGALQPGKRPDAFVEAVAALRRRGLGLRAAVVGDGPEAAALAPAAAAAGVELLGPRADVPQLLGRADVLAFPSRPAGEGIPGVLIEAGLCGVPVVATDVPGVRSVLEDGVTGIVVPRDDPGALADGMARLLGDAEMRRAMGIAARARCEARFSTAKARELWLEVLSPLVG